MKALLVVLLANAAFSQQAPPPSRRAIELQGSGKWVESIEILKSLAAASAETGEEAYLRWQGYSRLASWASGQLQAKAPNSARWFLWQGEAFAQQGKTAAAIAAYEKAVAADAKLAGSHLALAFLYAQAGRTADALREADRELALAPGNAAARNLKQRLGGR